MIEEYAIKYFYNFLFNHVVDIYQPDSLIRYQLLSYFTPPE